MTGPRMTRPRGAVPPMRTSRPPRSWQSPTTVHPAGGSHDGHELGGRGSGGRSLHGHEGMEDVGAEDHEHEAKQDAADEVEIFHGGRHSLGEVVERRHETL